LQFHPESIYTQHGKKLIENKDPLLNEFIDKKIFMYNSILKKLEGKTGEEIEKKIKISTEKISKLENLKK
jgi:tRNA (adenine22-N1)-methyltransferase